MDLETAKRIARDPETHYSIRVSEYRYMRQCQALSALLTKVDCLEKELRLCAGILETDPKFATIAASLRENLEEG